MLSQEQNKEVEKCILQQQQNKTTNCTELSHTHNVQSSSRVSSRFTKASNHARLQQLDASSVSCTAVFPVTDSVVLLYTTRCKFCTRVISHFFSFLLLVCCCFLFLLLLLFVFFSQGVICHNRGKSMPR